MGYEIRLGADAHEELMRLPVFHRRRLVEVMRAHLTSRPALDRKPRKLLTPDPEAGISASIPLWQLRVGDYRVFYDVDEASRTVMIQRIAKKGRRSTRETLR